MYSVHVKCESTFLSDSGVYVLLSSLPYKQIYDIAWGGGMKKMMQLLKF